MMSCLLAASMAVTLFAGSFSVPAYAAETGSLDTGAGLSEFIAADTEEASEEVNPDGVGAGYTEASSEAVYPDQAGTGTEGTVETTGTAIEDIPDTLSFVMEGDDGSVSDSEYMLEETGEVLDISQSDDPSKETASYAYTGKAIKPVVHIYDGNTYLCEKADFTVSYKNNKNPYTYKNGDTATKSTPSVIVKMKGNYSGTVTLYFEIRPVGTEYTYAVSPGVAYKGKPVKVVPEVYGFYNGPAKLKIGKDFVISSVTKDSKSYTNFVENKNLTVDGAGSYEVTLKYTNDVTTSKTGTYTGEKTFTVTAVDVTVSGSKTPISKVGLGKSKNLVIKGDCSQSENVTLPDLTVKAGSNTLKASDYTVDWYFNEDGKTANVCVAADDSSEYVGEKVVKVKLAGTGKIADTKGDLSLAYTGEAVEFDIVTTDNTNAGQLCVLNSEGKALTEGTDFTVSYENNTRVGKGTLIIKGCNEYCASVLKKTFTISSSGTLTVSVEDKDQVPYTQKGTKGNVTVTYTQGDKTYTLAEKTDYTLKYVNNTALGKATVTATGKGTYKGATGSCDYNIVKSTDADKVWVDAADVVLSSGLTGAKAKKTKVVVSETGTGAKLKAKTDYEIAGFYIDEAMTSELSDSAALSAKDVIYVKITGKGNYEGLSATGVFRVYKKTAGIKSAKIIFSDNGSKVYDETKKGFYYTGSEITPGSGNYEGTIQIDGAKDKFQSSRNSSEDGYYIDPLSFLKNVNKGTGSFMLYGTGSLGGSKKVSFKILQKAFSGERGSLDGSETLKLIGELGNLESAYVMWEPYSGKNTVDGYNVYYREKSEDSWTKADDMLVRSYAESAGSTEVAYWRADVPGLAAGEYCLKVVGKTGSEELNVSAITEVLTVKAHDRSGYAFTGDQTPGAYKADGTLKDDAYVLYVTEKTKDTVTMYVTTDDSGTKTLCVGIQSILSAYSKGYETHSLAVRMIGNITDPTNLNSGDLGVGNRNYKGCGITIEGVGDDTVANGFGISIGYGNYIEVRNLAVMNCDSSEGDSISLAAFDYYVWVHNCDLFYGEPGSDSDQKKGDGALDCKWSSNATFSYNHFWDTGKSNLLGLVEKVESTADDAL
ncbi:MAG: hypothetical protein K6E33_04875, partial [Lachnospiraceae bacterium]|nr:hypothetical protein [Lachnospiraceae bacterium]